MSLDSIQTINLSTPLMSENISYSNKLPPLEACDSLKEILLTSLYLLTSLISFSGNLISIIVLIVGKRSSRELKKFLINLSVSDILMALFSIPFTFTDFMLGRWVLPSILCPFAQFITIFSLCASVGTLTVIAVERFVNTYLIIQSLNLSLVHKFSEYLISN